MTIFYDQILPFAFAGVVVLASAMVYSTWRRDRVWNDKAENDIDRVRVILTNTMRDLDSLRTSVVMLNEHVEIVTSRLEALENPPLREIEVPDEPFNTDELPSLREV